MYRVRSVCIVMLFRVREVIKRIYLVKGLRLCGSCGWLCHCVDGNPIVSATARDGSTNAFGLQD